MIRMIIDLIKGLAALVLAIAVIMTYQEEKDKDILYFLFLAILLLP